MSGNIIPNGPAEYRMTALSTGLRRVAERLAPDPAPDGELLARFLATRDEAAFASLVRRHASLVFGTCRRVLGNAADADDAFQAAFVVLARRAGGIDPARPLGPWLYGVAHRVALRARTMIGRRRRRETLAAAVPEVAHHAPAVDDAAAVLDEEIGKLPAAARDALILCELQGLSRREAAARLGVAEGTLSSRLAAARKSLAVRLQSRGVVLGVALASAAVVSSDLVAATVAAGTGASLAPVVVSLADGASAMTLLNKLKLATVAAVFALCAMGYGLWPAGETAAAPVPKPQPDGELLWVLNDITFELRAYSPDGKLVKELKLPEGNRFLGITPDGQKIAFAGKKGKVVDAKETDGLTVHLRDIGTDTAGTDTGLDFQPGDYFVWSADAGRVVRSRPTDPEKATSARTTTLYDLATRKSSELKLPTDHHAWQWAPDGRWLLVYSGDVFQTPNWYKYTPADGTLVAIATNFPCFRADLSPDGKSLIGYVHRVVKENGEPRHDRKLVRVDVSTGVETTLGEFAEPTGFAYGWARWSPDGNRLAFWCEVKHTADDSRREQLSVCDADTGERKAVAELPSNAWVLQGWFPAARQIKAPAPKEKADAGLIWTHSVTKHALTAYTPDGKVAKEITLPADALFIGFTPDGAKMLFAGKKGKAAHEPGDELTLHVGDISEKCEGEDTGLGWQVNDQFALSTDGKQVVRSRRTNVGPPGGAWQGQRPEFAHVLYDLTSKKETKLDLPADHQVMQWSADGKAWRVMQYNVGDDPKLPNYRWFTAAVGEKPKLVPICDGGSFLWLDQHPDGEAFSGWGFEHPAGDGAKQCLFRVADGKAEVLAKFDGLAYAVVRSSPDGKRIACLKYQLDPQVKEKIGDSVLVTFDADGKNEAKLVTAENDGQNTHLLGWFPTDPKAAPEKKDEPKAKPVEKPKLPAKVDRAEYPPELNREIGFLENDYLGGRTKTFADLETKAADLAKVYTYKPDDGNAAHVWLGIANIAARNGVDKSADRVRKYAEKCLKTSHDPLDRSRAYSLLASCEEVGEGEFADRRRKAAEWLLAGYFELLAQELPDERPAVPAKRLKIDDFPPDPDRGVQYYNWCKAYEKAKWEGEQIDRRDVLVQQLRSLYEPNAKVHGHTTDGPHELRKLAEAKLPTAEDAEKLVERVSEK